MKTVLFVCTGNICRSPMAEGLMRNLVAGRKDFRVFSAGVHAQQGAAASLDAVTALREEGVDLRSFRSQPVTGELLDQSTHVFTMTQDHKRLLDLLFPEHEAKIRVLGEFTRRGGTCRIRSVRDSPPTSAAVIS